MNHSRSTARARSIASEATRSWSETSVHAEIGEVGVGRAAPGGAVVLRSTMIDLLGIGCGQGRPAVVAVGRPARARCSDSYDFSMCRAWLACGSSRLGALV